MRAENRRLEDRTRIGSVALPHYSPEHGLGTITPQAPSDRDLGVWLYGLGASFDAYYERRPDHRRKVDRVFQAFVDFDAAARDWRAAARSGARSGLLANRASQARRRAERRRVVARRRLQCFLRFGLERREGERLHGEEKTWIHLAARGFEHTELRVCEQCAVVFRAPRARRCPDCRRRPVGIRLHPLELGGWHVGHRVGNRWASEPFDRTVYYTTLCAGCEARFETPRPDGRYCLNCRSGSGRVRRHRGGSRTGRQRYRFAHAEGAAEWTISFNRLDGQTVLLTAVDGVVETDDAEIAKALDANSTVRREPAVLADRACSGAAIG